MSYLQKERCPRGKVAARKAVTNFSSWEKTSLVPPEDESKVKQAGDEA